MSQTIVIIGGGLTAAKAAEELRSSGFDGRLVVFGEEQHLPYERPPLSKGYLLGNEELDQAFVHGQDWYDGNDVDLRVGTRVTALDVAEHVVVAGDTRESYDRLLLATGATPRRLQMADASGAPVAYLRTIEDSTRLKESFSAGRRVVVVGGGWIGLEVTAAARQAGCEVVVLEALELPLLRVLGPEVASRFADLHRAHGVDLRTNARLSGVERDGERAVVRLEDGSALPADLVVVGVGVGPNDQLAAAAGLKTENGVVVDEHLRSSDPDVYAAGDVANAAHPVLGRHIRVEHWDNAIEQGKAVANSLLGQEMSYDRMPYFFTDQYDLGMEYVGHVGPEGYDEVVLRGGPDVYTAFWLREGRVQAGMHVNDWDAIEPVRALVGTSVDPARLRDEQVPLADLAAGSGS